MNILLLSTDIDVWALGLRSISAVVKAAGHHTSLVFMTTSEELFSQKTLEEIASLACHTDLVGVSCLAQGSNKAKQVIDYLHSTQKKMVVWGGVHASLNPEEGTQWADIVCRGEGEGMMLDLLEHLEQEKDWKDIENIAYREKGSLKLNKLRPPISNLDDLPLPDFSFENEYHMTPEGFIQVSTLPKVKDSGRIIFNGSRGCSFHCTYCCNSKLKDLYSRKDRYVRRMSIPRLIEHAQNLRKIFPQGTYFYFIDEDFGARPLDELHQLAEEYPLKVGLPFACLSHPARVSQEKMALLVKSGLFQIHVGIESGSERTRKEIYDRHVSNDVMIRAAEIISGYSQVAPFYFVIYGNPYEEKEDLSETIRMISSLPHGFYLQAYNLVFFPGSSIHERGVQDGLIEGSYDCGYEMNYLSGFNYERLPWKKKNLYLNGLISLMDGMGGRNFLGFVPRFMINTLLDHRLVSLNEKHSSMIRLMISLKVLYIKFRLLVMRNLKKIIQNPIIVSNLRRKAFS